MGSRWRLKKTVDISRYSAQAQVILIALKKYGMFMSDIGDDWQIDGTLDADWSQSLVNELVTVPSSELEAVDESSLMVNPELNPDNGGSTCYSGAAKKR
jgi:hypothetical protein